MNQIATWKPSEGLRRAERAVAMLLEESIANDLDLRDAVFRHRITQVFATVVDKSIADAREGSFERQHDLLTGFEERRKDDDDKLDALPVKAYVDDIIPAGDITVEMNHLDPKSVRKALLKAGLGKKRKTAARKKAAAKKTKPAAEATAEE